MKRTDRSLKLKERKNKEQRVVKCYLRSLIINNKKDDIVDAINQRVLAFSKRQVIASIGLNFLIKELFHNVPLESLKDVQIPEILEVTFIRQLLLGTQETIKTSQEIVELYKRHPYLQQKINDLPRHLGDRNIYSSGAIKFSTNVWNHFWTTFKKRMYRFLECLEKDYRSAVLFYLMNWEMTPEKKQILESLPKDILTLIELQKGILGTEQIDEKWLKDKNNINILIRYNIFISRFISEKQFNIIPMSKTKCHYIAIDTSTLYGVLKELNIIKCNFENFESLKAEQWQSIINTSKLEGKNNVFTNTIETDGFAVSVHFERPKKEKNAFKELDSSKVEYWGCDPGRTNIYFMTKKNEDGSFKSLKLSRNQYYKESGILKAREQSNRWQNTDHMKDIKLSLFSPKGYVLETFIDYVKYYLVQWNTLWMEYGSNKWSNQKMKLYGGKKRVFSSFFEKMKNPEKITVVGYGSSKFNPSGKNEVAVPTTSAYKECINRFITIPVDEFRTTKIYHGDSKTILQGVKMNGKRNWVRGLLWYSSTIDSLNKFINRDLNASINILNCLLNPTDVRPPMLSRCKDNQKIVLEVGKIISC